MSLTKDLQQAISKAEIHKGNIVAENFNYFFAGELDVISVNGNGYVHEFEIKISRSDFKADAKKRKWDFYDNPEAGYNCKFTPNYFTYVCPAGVILPTELKPYMGLIQYHEDGSLEIIRKPKIIHKYKHDLVKLMRKMCTVNNWKAYYGAQRLTLLAREIKERNDDIERSRFTEKMSHIHNHITK